MMCLSEDRDNLFSLTNAHGRNPALSYDAQASEPASTPIQATTALLICYQRNKNPWISEQLFLVEKTVRCR